MVDRAGSAPEIAGCPRISFLPSPWAGRKSYQWAQTDGEPRDGAEATGLPFAPQEFPHRRRSWAPPVFPAHFAAWIGIVIVVPVYRRRYYPPRCSARSRCSAAWRLLLRGGGELRPFILLLAVPGQRRKPRDRCRSLQSPQTGIRLPTPVTPKKGPQHRKSPPPPVADFPQPTVPACSVDGGAYLGGVKETLKPEGVAGGGVEINRSAAGDIRRDGSGEDEWRRRWGSVGSPTTVGMGGRELAPGGDEGEEALAEAGGADADALLVRVDLTLHRLGAKLLSLLNRSCRRIPAPAIDSARRFPSRGNPRTQCLTSMASGLGFVVTSSRELNKTRNVFRQGSFSRQVPLAGSSRIGLELEKLRMEEIGLNWIGLNWIRIN